MKYFVKNFDIQLGSIITRIKREIAVFQELSLGVKTLLLGIRRSYDLSFFMATLFFSVAMFVVEKITATREKLAFSFKKISFRNLSRYWLNIRIVSIASGFPDGIFALSWSLLAFEFFGQELKVGWFNGFLNLVGVLAAYLAGRMARPERRLLTATTGAVLYFAGTMLFGISFSILTFYLLGVLAGIGDHFLWAVEFPVLMKEIERGYLPRERRYFYWVNREIFVNFGRILGLAGFVFLAGFFAFDLVYRILFITVALTPFIMLIAIKNLVEVEQ